MTGCQYAGKTTLAVALSNWMIQAMGLPFVRWHNHFVVPKLDQHLIVESESRGPIALPGKQDEDMNTEADEEQIMALRPSVLEQLQRRGAHMARVVTADGTTVGLATLEDVIEELVGEIRDAAHHDEPSDAVPPVIG